MKVFKIKLFLLLVSFSCQVISAEINIKNSKAIACDIRPRITHKTQDKYHTRPHLSVIESSSLNWSGYATVTNLTRPTQDSVSGVSGTWLIPALSSQPNTTYSSIWVGIDGYADSTVEQIGTEQDWVSGKQQNYAWFEMYPQYSYEIVGFPVNVGDSISASVAYQGNNVFLMVIINNTRGVHFVVPTSYTISATAQRNSAEWIVEAPYNNGVLPLSDFNTVTFSNCLATVNNITGPINNCTNQVDPLTMITSNGIAKAVPSALTSNGQGFSVAWKHQ